MSRLAQLESFCFKIGILIKTSTSSTSSVSIGPYGYLLLKQIKDEWLKANLFKFENNFLIESQNLLDLNSSESYANSLKEVFRLKSLPIGLINVFDANKNAVSKNSLFGLSKSAHETDSDFLVRNLPETYSFKHLNCFHFYNNGLFNNSESTLHLKSFKDPFTFLQREKKNWWIKILNNPEHFCFNHLDNENVADLVEFDLGYKLEETTSWLENIKHVKNVTPDNEYLRAILNKASDSPDSYLLSHTKQLIITRTNCENVLKNILLDSVEVSPNNKSRYVFSLDFRLAPFKACIVYDQSSTSTIAVDLRKKMFMHNLNVITMGVSSETELGDLYGHLDEIGVPFVIWMPSTILKNGACFIRNRDTSLSEQTHIDRVTTYFCSITNALNY
jgi:hypothetical protein